jgi:hypothetical protein
VAEYAFTSWGLLIAPLLIAISMLGDGFIAGPIDVFMEKIKNKNEEGKHKEISELRRDANRTLAGVTIYLLMLGYLIFEHNGMLIVWLHLLLAFAILALLFWGHLSGLKNFLSSLSNKKEHSKMPHQEIYREAPQMCFNYFSRTIYYLKNLLFWIFIAAGAIIIII